MNAWILIVIVAVLMAATLSILTVRTARKQAEIRKKHEGYPKGYFMGQGMSIGIALGAGVGVALGNIAVGVGIGVAIGAAIGSGMEKKHEDEIRPMTEEEKSLQKQSLLTGMITLALGIALFLIVFFLMR